MIIAISATFVTCRMSNNTADFLCQCIVHVLGIILFFLVIFEIPFCFVFLRTLSNKLSPTDRFVYRAGDCVPDRQVCVQSRRLCPQLWVDFCTLYGEKKIKD